MRQVADWLNKLGLAQCAQRFAENDISFSVLTDLAEDFKEIGLSLGHRRPFDAQNPEARHDDSRVSARASTPDCRRACCTAPEASGECCLSECCTVIL